MGEGVLLYGILCGAAGDHWQAVAVVNYACTHVVLQAREGRGALEEWQLWSDSDSVYRSTQQISLTPLLIHV